MKAYLMHRDVNPAFGIFEWWKTEDGKSPKTSKYRR